MTLVGRSDGSSVFAPGNKYEFYPSIAGAWRISEEPFMQNQGIFKDLKLRASYGKSGNQAISPYNTLGVLVEEIPLLMVFRFRSGIGKTSES